MATLNLYILADGKVLPIGLEPTPEEWEAFKREYGKFPELPAEAAKNMRELLFGILSNPSVWSSWRGYFAIRVDSDRIRVLITRSQDIPSMFNALVQDGKMQYPPERYELVTKLPEDHVIEFTLVPPPSEEVES